MKRYIALTVILMAVAASPAMAIDIQNFNAALGHNNLFVLYTSDTLQPWQWIIGDVSSVAGNPMEFTLPDGEELVVVEQLLSNQFYTGLGLAGYVDIAVSGSYNRLAGTDMDRGAEISEVFPDDIEAANFSSGDMRIVIKGRILENKPKLVGIALVPFVHIPTGFPEYYNGAGAIDAGGLLVLDKRFDRINIVLNGGYKYKGVSEGENGEDIIPSDEFLMGLGLSVWAHKYIDIIAEINGKTVDYGLDNVDPEVPMEANLGARLYAGYGLSFILGGGAGLTSGIGSPLYRGFAGFEFAYPKIDRTPPLERDSGPVVDPNSKTYDNDHDQLTNWDETNKYGTDFMNPDTDGDGLKDGDEILTYKTDPAKADTDADELTDGEEIKLHKSNPLKMDSDGDTIADGVEVTKLKTNPASRDTDGDKIADNVDGAPLQAETLNGYQDSDGVPEVTLAKRPSGVIMFEDVIWLPNKIVWTGSRQDKIDPVSKPMIDDIAVILNDYSDINVNIECHVPRGGNETKNVQLTQRRAENIRKYLAEKGVAPSRMTAIGNGSDYPVASNATPEGKAKNERTEFMIKK